ncbi:phage tail fiber protein [Serratia fonticola]|uniref:phage tail fiber protein n=1 Tax=Serratia fonticola TaxID=47917 RepID=UPI00217C7F3F|nr:prophage tail fiber N-terminal domain-containing protein [Serratia fonticola]CAI1877114.1 Prophage tail fibre N-terminal [Serratia fonticola]
MAVITGVLKGPIGDARVGVVIELRAVRTSASVVIQARSQSVTDATGRYTLSVEPGQYDVMITAAGRQPERVGVIQVMVNSATGTLNDFLLIPGESDLNPAIVATVDQMRAEAAASAIAAKTSENNASAAMTNALSKVVATEQTVASSVKFNNGITLLGENVMQSKTPGANVITRYKDMDGVEKGAIFVTPATGQMTQRWGGTDFSAIYSADGRVTFPSDIYIGSLKVATQSTSLGTLDLNTVKTEGDYYQAVNTNATEDNHYPSGQAGVLRVLNSRAGVSGQVYITQLFYPYKANDFYYQRSHDAGTTTWSDWDVFYGRNKNDSRYLQTGSYGLGVVNNSGTFDFTKLSVATGFYRGIEGQNGAPPGISSLAGTSVSVSGGYIGHVYAGHGVTPGTIKLYTGWTRPDGTITFVTGWHSGNTTVDANGFIKKASPIVKLFGNGQCELNDESQGVTTERVSEGVYRVSGTLGFNSDAEWGGVDGGIEIPIDRNKLPLVWVDYEVDEYGGLLIKTFHRVNSTAPKFAQNVKVGYKEGQPIDIPASRWIDLRVEMPGVDVPEYIPEPEPGVTPDPIPPEELPQEPEGGEESAPLVEPKE